MTRIARRVYVAGGVHLKAALALNIHEERIGALYQTLELVRALFQLRRRMQQVNIRLQHLQQVKWVMYRRICNTKLSLNSITGSKPFFLALARPPELRKRDDTMQRDLIWVELAVADLRGRWTTAWLATPPKAPLWSGLLPLDMSFNSPRGCMSSEQQRETACLDKLFHVALLFLSLC